MNEEIRAQIIPIIESTKEGLAKAVDFLCEQSPILVKEILYWHGTRSAIWFLVLVGLSVLGICYLKRVWGVCSRKHCEKRCGTDECFLCQVGAVAYMVIVCVVPLVIALNTLTWLKVLIAPRLFLLEFMKDAIT